MTGGGKDLKNQVKSYGYLYKFLNITKNFIKEIIEELKHKPLNRSIQNTASRLSLVNKKLTFAAYDRIGGEASHCGVFFLYLIRIIKSACIERASRAHGFCGLFCLIGASRCGAFFLCLIQKFRCAVRSMRILNFNQLNSKGSILIEFAVCMPILIILLFYIHDLVKLKRYYMQSEFAGQQMANILQNVSKGQRVTLTNMRHAAALAWLSIYPGKTMHSISGTDSKHELSHDAIFVVHYVKGLSGGKASVLWCCSIYSGPSTSPNTIYAGSWRGYAEGSWVTVKGGTNVTPSSIYPTLKINEGEKKIIVESQIVSDSGRMNPSVYIPTDNRDTRAKKAFGLHLIFPKSFSDENPDQGRYFPSVVIFTPKPGLFDETPPSDN